MFTHGMTEPSSVMLRKKQPQFLDDSFADFQYKREIRVFHERVQVWSHLCLKNR